MASFAVQVRKEDHTFLVGLRRWLEQPLVVEIGS